MESGRGTVTLCSLPRLMEGPQRRSPVGDGWLEDTSEAGGFHFVPVLFEVACGLLEKHRDAEHSWLCIVWLSTDQHPELKCFCEGGQAGTN